MTSFAGISRGFGSSFWLTLVSMPLLGCGSSEAEPGTELQQPTVSGTGVTPPSSSPGPTMTAPVNPPPVSSPAVEPGPVDPVPAPTPPLPQPTVAPTTSDDVTDTTSATQPTSGETTAPAPVDPPAPVSPEPAPNTGAQLGQGQFGGSGSSDMRYQKADVTRNGVNYFFMANGWGPEFEDQSVTWNGTSFTVVSMNGSPGRNYEPASYPTMFCGRYSDSQSKECGLPATIDSIDTLRTGWRWKANGNTSDYNAAYDIWIANNGRFAGYLMVWLRDPPGQQPAGMVTSEGVTVANVPGTWDVWTGRVNNAPIINWVKPEGQDIAELEFDVMDFVRDAPNRGFQLPGNEIMSVAVGFEIWEGPVSNLVSEDFYVDVKTK